MKLMLFIEDLLHVNVSCATPIPFLESCIRFMTDLPEYVCDGKMSEIRSESINPFFPMIKM